MINTNLNHFSKCWFYKDIKLQFNEQLLKIIKRFGLSVKSCYNAFQMNKINFAKIKKRHSITKNLNIVDDTRNEEHR